MVATERAKAQHKMGDKLVIAAPPHSGLPNGANAMVACVHFDGSSGTWVYDVTLSGGGKHGSDVRYVKAVREGWLRNESRIATAKTCAPMVFGEFARLAPRLFVPLFQRRYCWTSKDWLRLWRDIASPHGFGPHFVGRVVVCHEQGVMVIVDGQQRCTTMMLLLTALRDAARELAVAADGMLDVDTAATSATASKAANALAQRLQKVLTTRKPLVPKVGAEANRASSLGTHAGLEGLGDAWRVRMIPSREDRLPFCSLVLGAPFDQETGGARKMADCHSTFRHEIEQALAAATRDVFEVQLPPAVAAGQANAVAMQRLAQSMGVLERLAHNALEKISVIVFELQDGVAIQNMYDMLAQREAAIHASNFFPNIGGRKMSPADLVRNLLLNHIAEEEERSAAYDNFWRPIERSNGDGDAQRLEAFLESFLSQRGMSAVHASRLMPPPPISISETAVATDVLSAADASSAMQFDSNAQPSGEGEHSSSAATTNVHEGFANILKCLGGSNGLASMYAAEVAVDVVDPAAASRAALQVLAELKAYSAEHVCQAKAH